MERPQIQQKYEISASNSFLSFSQYAELIKSKQTFLLVYTTFFAYLISAWPNSIALDNFVWTIIGIFFAVSGSTLLNMYIDRDIDAIMPRTKDRLLPSGKVLPSTVLKHGILFTTAGILAIGLFVNFLTMIVVFLGFFFDVVVYSLLLKRRTRYSIIFGGIAGGLPAMAGRTAVLGVIDLPAVLMGLFVLTWIPLHILTLALIPDNLKGYRDAAVPMWPVVSSKQQSIRVITFSAVLSASFIVLAGISLEINLIVLLPLIAFCLYVLFLAMKNFFQPEDKRTYRIFKVASMFMGIAYLWLFIGVVLTTFLV